MADDDSIVIEDIDIEIEEEPTPTPPERKTLIPDYDVEGFARAVSGELRIDGFCGEFGVPEFEEHERPTRDIPPESLSALVRASVLPFDDAAEMPEAAEASA
ncbi:MAG: hypothetical protein ABIP39_08580 [Polyangiaceae bacterium]